MTYLKCGVCGEVWCLNPLHRPATEPTNCKADEPTYAFTTDGCSGGMTLLWEFVSHLPPPWNDLCVEHDKKYWRGGSAADRRKADRELLAGVALNGHPVFAVLMWLAVRIGGHPIIPIGWRWGYGYPWPRGYQ